MNQQHFTVKELKTDQGAYNGFRYLNKACRHNKDNIVAISKNAEGQQKYPERWIITFPNVINNKPFFVTELIKSLERIAKKWIIGNFIEGCCYNTVSGDVFDSNSLSAEILGVSFEECMETAKLLCVTYHQNCVLVKNSTTDKLFLVIRDAHLQNETNKTIRL